MYLQTVEEFWNALFTPDIIRIVVEHTNTQMEKNHRKDRKTKMQCPSCHRPMCDEHRIYLCIDCGGAE